MGAFEITLLILFFGGLAAFFIWNLSKWNKQQEAKERGLIKYNALHAGSLKHIDGLPMAGGSIVEFFYGKKKITFKKDNQEIFLGCDKIISMDLVLGKDVRSQAAAGAVAGKFLLGGLGGAALGAMLAATFYFIILYKTDDENKTIVLDSTGSNIPFKKILDDFKSNPQRETQKIEL